MMIIIRIIYNILNNRTKLAQLSRVKLLIKYFSTFDLGMIAGPVYFKYEILFHHLCPRTCMVQL